MRDNRSAESILAGFSLILKMAEQLSAEDFTGFIDSLTSIVERTASVYRASDHVGLEIYARKLEEHTRMLIAISLSQKSSLGELFEVLCTCHRLPRGGEPRVDVGTLQIVHFKVLVFPHPWGNFFLQFPHYLAKPSTQLAAELYFGSLNS